MKAETFLNGITALATLTATLVVWNALSTAKSQLQVAHLDELERRWAELSDVRDRVTGFGQTLPLDLFDSQKHGKEARDIRAIGNFFEVLGKKIERKYVASEDACDVVGHWVEVYWLQYKPSVQRLRDINRVPTLYRNFERLSDRCTASNY